MAEEEYIECNNVISHKRPFTEFDEGGWSCKVQAVAVEHIQNIPAADVAPVRHGEWANKETAATCTACGRSYDTDFEVKRNAILSFDFCPSCGARMDGYSNAELLGNA